MKHILILIAGTLCPAISCTTIDDTYSDHETQTYKLHTKIEVTEAHSKPEDINIETIGNIYTSVYKQITNTYNMPITKEKAQTEVTARLKPYIEALAVPSKDNALPKESTNIFDRINNSQLSPPAKSGLVDFIHNLILIKRKKPTAILELIENYETQSQKSALNVEDRRVALTTTTVIKSVLQTQNAAHEPSEEEDEDPREDKDWELSIGVLSIIINGSLQGYYPAVNDTLVAMLTQ